MLSNSVSIKMYKILILLQWCCSPNRALASTNFYLQSFLTIATSSNSLSQYSLHNLQPVLPYFSMPASWSCSLAVNLWHLPWIFIITHPDAVTGPMQSLYSYMEIRMPKLCLYSSYNFLIYLILHEPSCTGFNTCYSIFLSNAIMVLMFSKVIFCCNHKYYWPLLRAFELLIHHRLSSVTYPSTQYKTHMICCVQQL